MNEDFSLGKMSADARLTATFKYYEKTEQNGKIVITACLGKGDVPKLNRGYGLDGNELWLSLNNLYQSIRGKDDYTAADDIISWCQQYAHPYYASEDIEEYRWDIEKDTEYWDFSTPVWREPPVRTNGATPFYLLSYFAIAGSSPYTSLIERSLDGSTLSISIL